jgi:DMSO/TMAO reductase YedYZ molybdopterin-dependent catalytic subunit
VAAESDSPEFNLTELGLAARNHGMPLELLREPVTPIGLHYLLTHFDIPAVDPATWILTVDGVVESERTFDLEGLLGFPAHEVVSTMECAGNGRIHLQPHVVSQPWVHEAVGTGRWRGLRVRDVLEVAGVGSNAVEVLFTGLDHGIEHGEEQVFARSLPLELAFDDDVLLAYDLNGAPLPPQHGYPLRLLVPGWYGMTNVKWLDRITLIDEPFAGPQQAVSYRLRQTEDEAGEPLSRILPRALLVPPGIPDFPTRTRTVVAGRQRLEGRAWSGHAPITSVEVSDDGGATWWPAAVEPAELGPHAWVRFTAEWDAEPGSHVLACRAGDASGLVQPDHGSWNLGGYGNNGVQRIDVEAVAP